MPKLTDPKTRRKPPRLVRVRGAECPVHNGPVYLDGRRLVCPSCERYAAPREGDADMERAALIDGKPNMGLVRVMASICLRIARGDHLTAEDLLQDAVVLLLRKADQYDPTRGAVTTFAGLMCWSARQRANQRRRNHPEEDPAFRVRLSPATAADPDRPTPADEAEHHDLLDKLRRVVAALPDGQRFC